MNYDCSLVTSGQECRFLALSLKVGPMVNAWSKGTPNAGIAKFSFTSGKTHRLRLINAGSEGLIRFTIDNHNMIVFAQDFVPVVPYTTNVVTLGVSVEWYSRWLLLTMCTDWSTNRCHCEGYYATQLGCLHEIKHHPTMLHRQPTKRSSRYLLRKGRSKQDAQVDCSGF